MILLENFLLWLSWMKYSWEFSLNNIWAWYDLEDFRLYQKWDSIKNINWKLSAKYDEEYVSLFKEEKDVQLDVFIDNYVNTAFFDDKLSEIIELINFYKKKMWLSVNFWSFDKKSNLLNYLSSDYVKKSNINDIFTLNEFSKAKYKIVLSDFLFLDSSLIKNTYFKWKILFLVLPTSELLKNNNLDVLNWFYNKFFTSDLLEEVNKTYKSLSQRGLLEIIK